MRRVAELVDARRAAEAQRKKAALTEYARKLRADYQRMRARPGPRLPLHARRNARAYVIREDLENLIGFYRQHRAAIEQLARIEKVAPRLIAVLLVLRVFRGSRRGRLGAGVQIRNEDWAELLECSTRWVQALWARYPEYVEQHRRFRLYRTATADLPEEDRAELWVDHEGRRHRKVEIIAAVYARGAGVNLFDRAIAPPDAENPLPRFPCGAAFEDLVRRVGRQREIARNRIAATAPALQFVPLSSFPRADHDHYDGPFEKMETGPPSEPIGRTALRAAWLGHQNRVTDERDRGPSTGEARAQTRGNALPAPKTLAEAIAARDAELERLKRGQ